MSTVRCPMCRQLRETDVPRALCDPCFFSLHLAPDRASEDDTHAEEKNDAEKESDRQ